MFIISWSSYLQGNRDEARFFLKNLLISQFFFGDMFGISLLAYEAYGKVIGARQLRIMNPENENLIKYYSSFGGFTYKKSLKGNPHYLVKTI